jgi:protein tyrosine/serine phosphatase
MLLGASQSASIRQMGLVAPETPACTNANKATTDDEDCSTAGNSAWNTITTSRTAKPTAAQDAPYPGHAENIQLETAPTKTGEGVTGKGMKGALDFAVSPAANTCTNANKATTDDEDCSTAGNSAWNTISTSRTAKPSAAQDAPYPGHAEHIQLEVETAPTKTGEGVTGKGMKGALDFAVSPAANTCTNANKATTDDEDCSTAGNSAWNTITSARTAKPSAA